MGYEWRTRTRKYVYTGRRDPATGKVKKTYLGNGPHAQVVAAALARRRGELAADRAAVRAALDHSREADGLADALDDAAAVLAEAALLAAGFHRPNYGPWRKARDGNGRPGPPAPGGGGG